MSWGATKLFLYIIIIPIPVTHNTWNFITVLYIQMAIRCVYEITREVSINKRNVCFN